MSPETAAIRRDQGRERYRRRNEVTPDRYRRARYEQGDDPTIQIDAGPFAVWLQQVKVRDQTSWRELAVRFTIGERALRLIADDEQQRVYLSTVERALTIDGTHLREVYEDWYQEAA